MWWRIVAFLIVTGTVPAFAQTAQEQFCGQFDRQQLEHAFDRMVVKAWASKFDTVVSCDWRLGRAGAAADSFDLSVTILSSTEHSPEWAVRTTKNNIGEAGSVLPGIGDAAGYNYWDGKQGPKSTIRIFAAKGAMLYQLNTESAVGSLDNKTVQQSKDFLKIVVDK